MLKNERMAIDIITFMVTNYRLAMHHNGDPISIDKARTAYCAALKEEGNLTDDDISLLYLEGKIPADRIVLEKHLKLKADLERKMALEKKKGT